MILESNGFDYDRANRIWESLTGDQITLISDQKELRRLKEEQKIRELTQGMRLS